MPTPITLDDACRSCGGPIAYGGTGRRSTVCSPACRRAARADDASARRSEAAYMSTQRPTPQRWLDHFAKLTSERAWDDDPPPMYVRSARGAIAQDHSGEALASLGEYAVLDVTRNGTRWDNGKARARSRDAAAEWLAAHHPDELASFPAAL